MTSTRTNIIALALAMTLLASSSARATEAANPLSDPLQEFKVSPDYFPHPPIPPPSSTPERPRAKGTPG